MKILSHDVRRAGSRCGTCGVPVTPRCVICRGEPDAGVTIEQIARGVYSVDRAAASRRAAA